MSTEERREVKKKLRREVLARRAALTEPERERGNLLITERILGHQWYYLSDTILGFVSYGSEICTTEILENALQDGKRVYVPKVDEHFMASLAVIPLQLLGYYVSVAKGLDVDKPRNLAKSVTVE